MNSYDRWNSLRFYEQRVLKAMVVHCKLLWLLVQYKSYFKTRNVISWQNCFWIHPLIVTTYTYELNKSQAYSDLSEFKKCLIQKPDENNNFCSEKKNTVKNSISLKITEPTNWTKTVLILNFSGLKNTEWSTIVTQF